MPSNGSKVAGQQSRLKSKFGIDYNASEDRKHIEAGEQTPRDEALKIQSINNVSQSDNRGSKTAVQVPDKPPQEFQKDKVINSEVSKPKEPNNISFIAGKPVEPDGFSYAKIGGFLAATGNIIKDVAKALLVRPVVSVMQSIGNYVDERAAARAAEEARTKAREERKAKRLEAREQALVQREIDRKAKLHAELEQMAISMEMEKQQKAEDRALRLERLRDRKPDFDEEASPEPPWLLGYRNIQKKFTASFARDIGKKKPPWFGGSS